MRTRNDFASKFRLLLAILASSALTMASLLSLTPANAATTWTYQGSAASYYTTSNYKTAMSSDGSKILAMLVDASGNLRANYGSVAAGNPTSSSVTWSIAGNNITPLTAGTGVGSFDMALSADGTKATVVWIRNNTSIESASATVTANTITWGATSVILTSATTALLPKLHMSNDGTVATMIWTNMGGAIASASAKISGTTQTWSTATEVEVNSDTSGNSNPAISGAADGSLVTIAWTHKLAVGSSFLQLNTASARVNIGASTPVQTWGSITSLTGAGAETVVGTENNPIVSSSDGTQVAVAYSWIDSADTTANYAAYVQTAHINAANAAQTWSSRSAPLTELTKATANVAAVSVRVALSNDGTTATLAYFSRNQASAAYTIGTRSATISSNLATWSGASTLASYNSPVDTASGLKLKLSSDGTKALATWVKNTGGLQTSSGAIGAASNSATWETPVVVGSSYEVATSSDLTKAFIWAGGNTSALMGQSVAAPVAPTSVTATAGDTKATVSWTAPTTGGSPASYTATSNPGSRTCTATAPAVSCEVTGLTNGTSYTFTVTSTNTGGTSSASVASSALTPEVPAVTPGAPTGVSVTAGDTKATVSWTAPTTGGSPASYTATSNPGSRTCTATAPAVSCEVTGLTNGTSYTFTVTSTNSGGTSSASTASSATTPAVALAAPGTPTGVTATAGDAKATVSWSAPTSGGAPASYTVTSSPGSFTCTATSPATSCEVPGLTNSTAYTFTVTSTNTGGTSVSSTASAATTPVAANSGNSGGGSSGGNSSGSGATVLPPTNSTVTPLESTTVVQPGDDLTIKGSYPDGVEDVSFGTFKAASFKLSLAKDSVSAVVPNVTAGLVAITITDGKGHKIAAGTVTLLATGQKLVSLKAVSRFAPGSSVLSATEKSKLVSVARQLSKNALSLKIKCVGTAQKTGYSAADRSLASNRAMAVCKVMKAALPKATTVLTSKDATIASALGRKVDLEITYRK